mmetsp:Transcript_8681/g.24963  ORF Transcript_8681/g.24963 Transcript_8681/m.24963 type:complete len:210 (-) Transcript_8681:36-665(-)
MGSSTFIVIVIIIIPFFIISLQILQFLHNQFIQRQTLRTFPCVTKCLCSFLQRPFIFQLIPTFHMLVPFQEGTAKHQYIVTHNNGKLLLLVLRCIVLLLVHLQQMMEEQIRWPCCGNWHVRSAAYHIPPRWFHAILVVCHQSRCFLCQFFHSGRIAFEDCGRYCQVALISLLLLLLLLLSLLILLLLPLRLLLISGRGRCCGIRRVVIG